MTLQKILRKFPWAVLALLVVVEITSATVNYVQQERAARDRPRPQRRQQRNDRVEFIPQFMKRNGQLEGMVRLVDGAHDYEGNVEIFHTGKWGSICDDEWDIREATVVCRELGFADVVRVAHNSMYGPARHSFWMDNMYCSGSEKNLTECRFDGWSQNDCHEKEAAGVICKSGPVSKLVEPVIQPTSTTIPTTAPTSSTTTSTANLSAVTRGKTEPVAKELEQDMAPRMRIKDSIGTKVKIRLRSGQAKDEGLVEVKIGDDTWGLVCGDGWSLFEAGVVCRELGLGFAQNALQTDFVGGNRSSIALSQVQCHGSERFLEECFHVGIKTGVSCPGKRNNIAAVVCASEMADLVPDHLEMMRSAHLEYRQLFFLQCAMEENCLAASAYKLQKEDPYGWLLKTRRLLRFSARIANLGTADFKPFIPKHKWEWHACHKHYHSMEVFAHFDIIDQNGVKVAEGHKASFCLEDNQCSYNAQPVYKCANYGDQGISVNCTDTYAYDVDCQWIDITDIDPGTYTFKVVINPEFKVAEQTFDNNAAVCTLFYGHQYASLSNCSLQRP